MKEEIVATHEPTGIFHQENSNVVIKKPRLLKVLRSGTCSEVPQVYVCNDCKVVCWEEDLGSVKIHNYYKLFCTSCNSEAVELVKE
ncbi:hypothetical protein LCGC14_2757840 [marine sediment metagenome]|uniref:Uncharacterized protein n=1 Tax=marine sediment metagenome TaxID=412755 RepID=A0A0F9B8G4_9ZZZZ